MRLEELISQKKFASEGQKAMLNLMVTSSWVASRLNAVMAPFGLTPAQYNVLRILRGADPDRMTCSAIGARLLDRTPDVTRLLNRLEKAGLVDRNRSTVDRRVVEVSISAKGVELLDEVNPKVEAVHGDLSRHLTEADLGHLNDLLERYREDQVV